MARRIVIALVSLLGLALCAAGLYAVAGLGAFDGFGRSPAPAADKSSAVVSGSANGAALATAIESDFKANDKRADTAPKQQVVNGWAAKDALLEQMRQNDVLITQNGDLGRQLSQDTNLTLARSAALEAKLTALGTATILMLAAVCVLLVAVVVAVLWSPASAAVTAVPAESTAAGELSAASA